MLKERQLRILADLESTQVFISAKSLAQKYDVSLRTVRSDIEEIAYAVERHGGTLLRVPHKGLRIESDRSIARTLTEELTPDSFSFLEKKQQLLILLSVFLTRPNPITVNFLAETFDVNASTMSSRLKELEDFLAPCHVTLTGVKKKGYYLGGAIDDLVQLVDTAVQAMHFDSFHRFFRADTGALAAAEEAQHVVSILNYLSEELDISPLDSRNIQILLFFIAKNNGSLLLNRLNPGGTIRINQLETRFNLLLDFLSRQLAAPLFPLWEHCLRLAILNYTNAPSLLRTSDGETRPQNLDLAVHHMVEEALNYYPELADLQESLEQDLCVHIGSIINRLGAGLDIANPLLDEIQIRFSLLFSTVKELSKAFTLYYPLLMDDHQISYLVLYFAEYLEKATAQVPLRLLVVCNSGAGVAKLLSTRLRNHFPEITSIENASSYQLESSRISLDDVDLVVTTIPLQLRTPLAVPMITTSPFLTNDELLQIRKLFIELAENRSHIHRVLNAQDDVSSAPFPSIRTRNGFSAPEFDMDCNIFLAEVLSEVFALFQEIFPDGIAPKHYPVATGIITHIVMSLPRWTTGDFIKAYDLDELKLTYPAEFTAIIHFLDRVGTRLGIFIAPVEATAILRYMINDW